MIRSMVVLLLVAALVAGACSSSDATEDGGAATSTLTDTSSTLPSVPSPGRVDVYLTTFDPARLGGIGLPGSVQTDRDRVPEGVEASFVEAVRDDPANEQVGPVLTTFDDESLVYLGYLYCAAHDQVGTIAPSVAAVVDVVARANGRPATSPAEADFVTSVTIVNLASGSLCTDLYLDTNAFLEELLGAA